jgi:acyl-coenzyme A thioesterase PaaI-like protein
VNTDSPPGSFRCDLNETRLQSHPRCVVCAPESSGGLGLRFVTQKDGSVESCVDCGGGLEGYPQQLHGGVIALLLDSAMTNCLFAHGCVAVTGELKIRFRHPVATGQPAYVRAWIERSRPPLHLMAARVVQGGRIMASASAKFLERQRRWPSGTNPRWWIAWLKQHLRSSTGGSLEA